MDAFTVSVTFVLSREGGYENDPRDPGGETNYGIDKRSHPNVDIKGLTRSKAIDIYKSAYWVGTRADQLPVPVAIIYFDACVNQGATSAAQMLQEALGIKADGVIGPATISATNKARSKDLAIEYAARRALRYAGTKNFTVYGLGWMRRLMSCLDLSLSHMEV